MIRPIKILLLAALGLFAAIAPVGAQSYPAKPITVIVPFAAGGPTDIVARLLGEHMSRTLGQPFIIENVTGAGGTTGMTRMAQAAPDGYTIAVGNMGTMSAAPALYPNLKYDPVAGLAPISVVSNTAMVIITRKTMEAKTLAEFVTWLKANGDKTTLAHAGVGSISFTIGTIFNSLIGIKPGLVVYRGTAPAMNDLVAGQIDMIVDQATNCVPQIQAGTIKAYAVTSPVRLASLPDVPTTKEAGMPEFAPDAWNAMAAPKGTPKEAIDKLMGALQKAFDDPAMVKRFDDLGSTVPLSANRGPEQLGTPIKSEVARFSPILKPFAVTGN